MLQRIGSTPLLELKRIVPEGCARILIKVESANPTASMKDRMALAMIEAGERSGRLGPGGRVVEYTGGSTGVSLALVCAARGYPLSIVTSDAFSAEKRNHMAALGAELTIIPSAGGGMVRVKISGELELKELTIDPGAVDPEDVEMLQDMVQAAVNEAIRSAQELAASKMNAAAGGLAGPGGLGGLGIPGL